MAYELEGFDFDEHIDKLIDVAKSIKTGDITIMTGPNGYGKSFVRKLLGAIKFQEENLKVASISMEARTSPKEDFAAFRSMAMDDPTDATSNHTFHLTESIMKEENKFIVIDEPEIGTGKEILFGILQFLENKIEEKKKAGTFRGLLIITHSDFLIDNFKHDKFVNLEGMTYDEWKHREIKLITPDKLKVWSLAMWRAIQKRIKEKETEKSKI